MATNKLSLNRERAKRDQSGISSQKNAKTNIVKHAMIAKTIASCIKNGKRANKINYQY